MPVVQTSTPLVIKEVITSSTHVVQTSRQTSTSTVPEISPITSNHGNPIGQHTSTQSIPIGQDTSTQSNPIGEGASTQSNHIGEGDSSGIHARTLVILTTEGLQPSRTCSSFISESFKNELDPNEINWKGVSNDIRDGNFGEFKVQ